MEQKNSLLTFRCRFKTYLLNPPGYLASYLGIQAM